MSRLYDDLPTMLAERGIEREDSYDYGVWWMDEQRRAHRLTWIGTQWRANRSDAGELYLIRMSGPHVQTVSVGAEAATAITTGAASGRVELLCVIPPVAGDSYEAERADEVLGDWAEACGTPNSVEWIRDRVREALRAGWAREP